MAVETIPRQDARVRGLRRYFTGDPCKHGHIAERTTHGGSCVKCNVVNSAKSVVKWAAANPEAIKAIRLKAAAKFRNVHRERSNSQSRAGLEKWRKAHPERYREYHRVSECARRARKRAAGGSFTLTQIDSIFLKQKGRCTACLASIKSKYEIDHVVPLAKGGDNSIQNIQLLCPKCNRDKAALDPIEWAQKHGRLI